LKKTFHLLPLALEVMYVLFIKVAKKLLLIYRTYLWVVSMIVNDHNMHIRKQSAPFNISCNFFYAIGRWIQKRSQITSQENKLVAVNEESHEEIKEDKII
jgi:hypothetical protein